VIENAIAGVIYIARVLVAALPSLLLLAAAPGADPDAAAKRLLK
jgi:hypothetical protein